MKIEWLEGSENKKKSLKLIVSILLVLKLMPLAHPGNC